MTEESKKAEARKSSTAEAGESVYSVTELAEHAEKVFGPTVRPECVTAAFRMKKRNSAALEEAKEIVEAFLKREVM